MNIFFGLEIFVFPYAIYSTQVFSSSYSFKKAYYSLFFIVYQKEYKENSIKGRFF